MCMCFAHVACFACVFSHVFFGCVSGCVFGMRFWQYLSPLRQKVFPLNTFPRALTAGLLWGFLPCGLVYGALLIAVVAHNPLSGAALMFVFGLGTIPMLVATHETVGWLRDKIGRFRLRQLNGAVMVLSGLAVAVVPMVMANMHGGHGGGHAQMDHSSHSTMMSETDAHDMDQMNHDMTPAMNHDMTPAMDHDMQDTDNHMDHSMHDMGDDATSMPDAPSIATAARSAGAARSQHWRSAERS